MPFQEYEVFKDDFSDLEEKIIYLLENNNYQKISERSQGAFNEKHNPIKCYEYYHSMLKKHNLI
jgi:hypothetical protein